MDDSEIIGVNRLVEELTEQFADCVIGFNNGSFIPQRTGARKNFLHFPNNKKTGTTDFIKSVAIKADILLSEAGSNLGFIHRSGANGLNKDGNMQILQFSEITDSSRRTAEILLANAVESLPDSITIISKSRYEPLIFKGKIKSSDWGDETPSNQTPLNTTDSSKTQNPLNIPRTNEEKRYAYYKTLARPEQSRFRTMLLEEYNTTCVITGCTTKVALEAAHIIPFSQDGEDTLENGLLLRADLHLLFDKGFMFINPETSEVHFKGTDKNYNKYTHAKIPDNDKLRENLTAHWHKFQTT